MDNTINEKERRQEELRERYSRIHANGAGLYVSATPDEVARLYVREEISYMPDYIYDEHGSLIQIIFDRIEKK